MSRCISPLKCWSQKSSVGLLVGIGQISVQILQPRKSGMLVES